MSSELYPRTTHAPPQPQRRATSQVGRLVFLTCYFCVDVLKISLSTQITGHESTVVNHIKATTHPVDYSAKTLTANLLENSTNFIRNYSHLFAFRFFFFIIIVLSLSMFAWNDFCCIIFHFLTPRSYRSFYKVNPVSQKKKK